MSFPPEQLQTLTHRSRQFYVSMPLPVLFVPVRVVFAYHVCLANSKPSSTAVSSRKASLMLSTPGFRAPPERSSLPPLPTYALQLLNLLHGTAVFPLHFFPPSLDLKFTASCNAFCIPTTQERRFTNKLKETLRVA